jgi:hypothetical protein
VPADITTSLARPRRTDAAESLIPPRRRSIPVPRPMPLLPQQLRSYSRRKRGNNEFDDGMMLLRAFTAGVLVLLLSSPLAASARAAQTAGRCSPFGIQQAELGSGLGLQTETASSSFAVAVSGKLR